MGRAGGGVFPGSSFQSKWALGSWGSPPTPSGHPPHVVPSACRQTSTWPC